MIDGAGQTWKHGERGRKKGEEGGRKRDRDGRELPSFPERCEKARLSLLRAENRDDERKYKSQAAADVNTATPSRFLPANIVNPLHLEKMAIRSYHGTTTLRVADRTNECHDAGNLQLQCNVTTRNPSSRLPLFSLGDHGWTHQFPGEAFFFARNCTPKRFSFAYYRQVEQVVI